MGEERLLYTKPRFFISVKFKQCNPLIISWDLIITEENTYVQKEVSVVVVVIIVAVVVVVIVVVVVEIIK